MDSLLEIIDLLTDRNPNATFVFTNPLDEGTFKLGSRFYRKQLVKTKESTKIRRRDLLHFQISVPCKDQAGQSELNAMQQSKAEETAELMGGISNKNASKYKSTYEIDQFKHIGRYLRNL